MDQRRLRPGDRLDDYCPRERRLTDHVVVAVVGDTVKQTRCVACDTEHPFKGARVPARRLKKETAATLVERAVERDLPPDDVENAEPPAADPQPNLVVRPERKAPRGRRVATPPLPVPAPALVVPPPPAPEVPEQLASDAHEDEGPVHRRLIRATLPRPDGQVPTRPLPEFTIRQPGTRGGGGFARGGMPPRFGDKPAGGQRQHATGAWSGRPNGHGGQRSGAQAQGQGGGDARMRHKGGRSRSRPHHKKSR